MLDTGLRFSLTRDEIEYSDKIDEHWDLFHKGMSILENRIINEDYTEFTDDEREVLEEIYTIMAS